MIDEAELWRFLLVGYLASVLIETPVLIAGLSPTHSIRRRILAGLWLTACTYPVVVVVLPTVVDGWPRWQYLLIAETFAPAAECGLFAAAFHTADLSWKHRARDLATVTAANLTSFGVGEVLHVFEVL